MMMIVAVRRYPQGPRVWVGGQRLHHGATGCLMLLGLCRRRTRAAALVGAALALHDWRDRRRWFARESLPAISLDRSGAIHHDALIT